MNEILLWAYLAAIALALCYAMEIARNLRHWQQLPELLIPENFLPKTQVSIIIPARNEAANIVNCLQSLLQQDYPRALVEIIVVDDFSTDATPELVRQFSEKQVRLLQLSDFIRADETFAFKKKALEIAIAQATGELILTTDADCEAPPLWLKTMVACYEQSAVCIAGPVGFYREQNALEYFQSLDYLGMMLLTGAAIRKGKPYLANGANLAYPKAVFEKVNGFSGVDHLASGDDMLLLQKIARHFPNDKIHFAKSAKALMQTRAKKTFREFFSQRIRWASKSSAFRRGGLLWTLGVVFALCWSILLSGFGVLFFGVTAIGLPVLLLAAKAAADYTLLRTACRFFERRDLLRHFWSAQFLHIAYIAIIGLAALFPKGYEWKGRQVQ